MRVNTKGGVPPCDRRLDRRKVAIAAAAALFLFATVPATAGVIDFAIRQDLSSMQFSETVDLHEIAAGIHTTIPQFAGSDVTSIFGNILGNWDPGASTFELVSGGAQTFGVSTAPGVGGVPGAFHPYDPITTDPVLPGAGGTSFNNNFGVMSNPADPIPIGLFEVLHGMYGDWATAAPGPRGWNPVGGAFNYVPGADGLFNGPGSGRIAYVSGLGNSSDSLAGNPDIAYGTAGATAPTWDPTDGTAGPLGTLTLPIESAFTLTVDLSSVLPGATGYVTFASTGQIVATPKVPEPSSIILAVFGVVGLLTYGWRRHKRNA